MSERIKRRLALIVSAPFGLAVMVCCGASEIWRVFKDEWNR
jgi:hypothetical protein